MISFQPIMHSVLKTCIRGADATKEYLKAIVVIVERFVYVGLTNNFQIPSFFIVA